MSKLLTEEQNRFLRERVKEFNEELGSFPGKIIPESIRNSDDTFVDNLKKERDQLQAENIKLLRMLSEHKIINKKTITWSDWESLETAELRLILRKLFAHLNLLIIKETDYENRYTGYTIEQHIKPKE